MVSTVTEDDFETNVFGVVNTDLGAACLTWSRVRYPDYVIAASRTDDRQQIAPLPLDIARAFHGELPTKSLACCMAKDM
jgi:hypothetical protein